MRYSICQTSIKVLKRALERMSFAPRILFLALLLLSTGCAVARESQTPIVEAPTLPPEWTQVPEQPSPSPGPSNSPLPSITATTLTTPESTLTPYPSGSPVVRNGAPVELTKIQMFSPTFKRWILSGLRLIFLNLF